MASVGSDVSGRFLATAIAGIGMKTQLRELVTVGLKPAVLMVGETVFIALLVLALLPVCAASVDASLMKRYYGFDMTRAGATSGLLVIAGGVGMIAGSRVGISASLVLHPPYGDRDDVIAYADRRRMGRASPEPYIRTPAGTSAKTNWAR